MSLLVVKDLRTEIRTRDRVVRAVDGISLDVGQGETVGLVGESGSGKSMVANSIVRLLPPGGLVTGGSITLDGSDLLGLAEPAMRRVRGGLVGFVFQDPMSGLNPTMTIGRQIAEAVVAHRGVSRKEGLQRAREVLELVSVPRAAERLDDFPHQLSGGLRQRVVIAMALACAPRLLIADEPTTSLDVTIQAQILALLDDLKAQLSMALLLITHDLGVVAERADRVVVIYGGRVMEAAPTAELFTNIRHPYTEALLASVPRLDQDRTRRLYSIPGAPPDLSQPPGGCPFAPRCPRATPECATTAPPVEGSAAMHAVACLHPLDSPADRAFQLRPPAGTGEDGRRGRQPVPAGASAGPETPLLDLRDVSKEFPVYSGALFRRRAGTVHAVSNVSLTVARGETLGLVGESGCGKTTLGRMAATLETPTEGTVMFDGAEVGHLKEAELRNLRRHVQLVFQDPYSSLDPRMRVGAIIREPLLWQKVGTKASQRERVLELLDQVGLPRRSVERYPHEFSGGQRQRIALARALALYPRLIIADEPVSALDVSIRSQLLNLMKDLQSGYQLTYVVISHDLSVVRYVADRIAVMYLGKVVEIGNGEDIYARRAHPYTAGLLASIPLPDPRTKGGCQPSPLRGELPSPVNPPSGCRFRLRCPRARQICAEEPPPLRAIEGPHAVACHFPLAPGETMPVSSELATKG